VRSFWDGFEKQAATVAGMREGATEALSHAKTFTKGALTGAALTGLGLAAVKAGKTPTETPLQQPQGY
jgi:hypothetical protein